jgi:hypothetical protein
MPLVSTAVVVLRLLDAGMLPSTQEFSRIIPRRRFDLPCHWPTARYRDRLPIKRWMRTCLARRLVEVRETICYFR